MFNTHQYKPGERVIYCCEKRTPRPPAQAEAVYPEARGDAYRCRVRKFWIVVQVLHDGHVVTRTRRGKTRRIAASDPNLRPAAWWERFKYARRFPRFGAAPRVVLPKIRIA